MPRQIRRPPRSSPTMQSPFLAVYDETDTTGTVCPGGEFLYRPRLENCFKLKLKLKCIKSSNFGFLADRTATQCDRLLA